MVSLETQNPIKQRIKQFKNTSNVLLRSSYFTIGLLIFFTVGIFADSRMITGIPAWLKPAKFAISVTIYSFTMLWFLSFVDTTKRWRKRLVQIIGWTLTLTLFAEWVGIITQALRGTTSHFNIATSFDAAMWSLMAIAIFILFFANIAVVALLMTQRLKSPTLTWALRLAMIITVIGLAEGYLMTSPTAQQMAGWQAGEPITIVGAHSVGIEDGGPGLPFLNWSTEGGDLRIGHFIGMHALQVIPFFALFIMRRRRLNEKQKLNLVWIASAVYLGITALVTWQALRAQPFIQPDALTISVFLAIVLTGGLFATINLIPRKRVASIESSIL